MRNFFRNIVAIAIIGILHPATIAAPWEGPRLSEEELRKTEIRDENVGRTDLPVFPYKQESKLSLIFSYIEAFKAESNSIRESRIETKKSVSTLDGLTAITGLTSGIHSTPNNVFFALSVGSDILSWLTKDRTAEELANIQKRDYENFVHPSLWLVNIDNTNEIDIKDQTFEASDQKLHELFKINEDLLLSLPIDCEPAYYLTTTVFGQRKHGLGMYFPGRFHGRNYLCSHASKDVLPSVPLNESGSVSILRTSENIWVKRIYFTRLDRNTGIQSLFPLENDKKNFIAAELHKKLSPFFDKNWYAIYTAPDEKGEWKTYVSNDNIMIEYAIPPRPRD